MPVAVLILSDLIGPIFIDTFVVLPKRKPDGLNQKRFLGEGKIFEKNSLRKQKRLRSAALSSLLTLVSSFRLGQC